MSKWLSSRFPSDPPSRPAQQQPLGLLGSGLCVPNNLVKVRKYVLDMAGMSYANVPVAGDKFESWGMSVLATAVGYIFTRCPPSLTVTKHELAAPLDVLYVHGKCFLNTKLICGAEQNVVQELDL